MIDIICKYADQRNVSIDRRWMPATAAPGGRLRLLSWYLRRNPVGSLSGQLGALDSVAAPARL